MMNLKTLLDWIPFKKAAENKVAIEDEVEDTMCGICLENVIDKTGDNRFGLLSHCRHCFCWVCIDRWRALGRPLRQAIYYSCPACCVHSDFAVPSWIWIDSREEKYELFVCYLKSMRRNCKFFKCIKNCLLNKECYYRVQCRDFKSNDFITQLVILFSVLIVFTVSYLLSLFGQFFSNTICASSERRTRELNHPL